MFNHILVPLDGSSLAECVLPHLAAVAKASKARTTLIKVLDPAAEHEHEQSLDPFEWQVRKTEAESYLKGLAVTLEPAGLHASTVVLEGKSADAIIEFAHKNGVDLILMSSHGQSGISGWNVSSVVQKVILRARTSVMIIRAYQPPPEDIMDFQYQRILLPLDGSRRAETALPIAAGVAQYFDAEVIAVHVIREPEMPRRTPLSQEEESLITQVTERNRQQAAQYFEDLESRLNAKMRTRLLVSSQVSRALHTAAEQDEADLVVMSAHGYSGDAKWPYGTTVTNMILFGTTPLIVFQDISPERMEPSPAEVAAKEKGSAHR